MNTDTTNKLREIKARFRLMMNGVSSQSMREKGLSYKINWGISLPELKKMASDYEKDFDLAIALWKEDIRECRILATYLIPSSEIKADMVEFLVSDVRNTEIASIASLNIFQYVEGAKGFAFEWIASDDVLKQICGYSVMARLFMNNVDLDIREIHEFLDQVPIALSSNDVNLQRAAMTSLTRFGEQSEENETLVNHLLH